MQIINVHAYRVIMKTLLENVKFVIKVVTTVMAQLLMIAQSAKTVPEY